MSTEPLYYANRRSSALVVKRHPSAQGSLVDGKPAFPPLHPAAAGRLCSECSCSARGHAPQADSYVVDDTDDDGGGGNATVFMSDSRRRRDSLQSADALFTASRLPLCVGARDFWLVGASQASAAAHRMRYSRTVSLLPIPNR